VAAIWEKREKKREGKKKRQASARLFIRNWVSSRRGGGGKSIRTQFDPFQHQRRGGDKGKGITKDPLNCPGLGEGGIESDGLVGPVKKKKKKKGKKKDRLSARP